MLASGAIDDGASGAASAGAQAVPIRRVAIASLLTNVIGSLLGVVAGGSNANAPVLLAGISVRRCASFLSMCHWSLGRECAGKFLSGETEGVSPLLSKGSRVSLARPERCRNLAGTPRPLGT